MVWFTSPALSRRRLAGPLLVVIAVMLMAVLTACQSTAEAPTVTQSANAEPGSTGGGSYASLFEQARQQATSDFEREVLADDQITRAEYEEATQLWVECLAGKGVEVKLQDQGGYYTAGVPAENSEGFEENSDLCAEGTTAVIEPLYIQILQNPGNEDPTELIVACLIETGLADSSFTVEQWNELSSQGQNAQWPFDIEDPRWGACLTNPSDPQGY